jgi:hypothetical protein
MMRLRFVALALGMCVALVGGGLLAPETARAQANDDCVHALTISSLRTCVQHAADEGFIDNQGVTNSLLAKLDAAQAAVNRRQTSEAINQLDAFIHEVQAQAGKHIDQMHAHHLVMHAQMVIQALKKG